MLRWQVGDRFGLSSENINLYIGATQVFSGPRNFFCVCILLKHISATSERCNTLCFTRTKICTTSSEANLSIHHFVVSHWLRARTNIRAIAPQGYVPTRQQLNDFALSLSLYLSISLSLSHSLSLSLSPAKSCFLLLYINDHHVLLPIERTLTI